jgi:hypothetical protein
MVGRPIGLDLDRKVNVVKCKYSGFGKVGPGRLRVGSRYT